MDIRQRRDLENLVSECTPMVLRVAMGILHNQEDARDVCQEVFLRLFQNPAVANKKAWLYRATINQAINSYHQNRCRLHRETVNIAPAICHASPQAAMENSERLAQLHQAIAGLAEGQRSVFLLRHQAGLSIKEIADYLQLTAGTVKTQLSRALHKLRQVFEHEDLS